MLTLILGCLFLVRLATGQGQTAQILPSLGTQTAFQLMSWTVLARNCVQGEPHIFVLTQ